MPSTSRVPATNRLLMALPCKACEQLLATSEPVELNVADTLYLSGEFLGHVYFSTGSFISLMAARAWKWGWSVTKA